MLVRSPGMEVHIRPYKLESGEYLPTSPEFAMKRLLVGGLERIFQICPAFRYEPFSPHHLPEFTMLEWYRAYAGFTDIMSDMERLVESLAVEFFGKPEIPFQGKIISVKTPWPRLRVRDLFQERVGVDLVASANLPALRREVERLGRKWDESDTWDDLYFKIWLDFIEPNLPQDRAVFVTHYPASQSALAVVETDRDGSRWARRFEPYAGGMELGNAFEELTDPVEQRRRFVEDMKERERFYGESFPASPIDEDFLRALEEGLPPSGGIAVGVDRLVMLFADEPEIEFTSWLKPYVHEVD
jgi:lysyl-tRNA synthetase class 2